MQNQAESEAGMPEVLNPVTKWFALVFFALIALQAVPGAGLAATVSSNTDSSRFSLRGLGCRDPSMGILPNPMGL